MFFDDIFHLLFPVKCVACDEVLPAGEQMLCPACRSSLPDTHFEEAEDNPLARLFWGRVLLDRSFAMLYFTKKGVVQALLYKLKYQGRKDIGFFLGKRMGTKIMKAGLEFDMVVPVPLHKRKHTLRGYNQAEMIAAGIAEVLKIPCHKNILIREIFTETQTKKGKWERYLNVKEVFAVENRHLLKNKKVLLVDDVITTGATIEAGIRLLLEHEPQSLSVGAVATAIKQ